MNPIIYHLHFYISFCNLKKKKKPYKFVEHSMLIELIDIILIGFKFK